MSKHSAITGLTFPGIIDEPGCTDGRTISFIPVVGPDVRRRKSFATLISSNASSFRPLETVWHSHAMKMMPARPAHVVIGRAEVEIVFPQEPAAGILKPEAHPDLVTEIDGAGNVVIEVNTHAVGASGCACQEEIVDAEIAISAAVAGLHHAIRARLTGPIQRIEETDRSRRSASASRVPIVAV